MDLWKKFLSGISSRHSKRLFLFRAQDAFFKGLPDVLGYWAAEKPTLFLDSFVEFQPLSGAIEIKILPHVPVRGPWQVKVSPEQRAFGRRLIDAGVFFTVFLGIERERRWYLLSLPPKQTLDGKEFDDHVLATGSLDDPEEFFDTYLDLWYDHGQHAD